MFKYICKKLKKRSADSQSAKPRTFSQSAPLYAAEELYGLVLGEGKFPALLVTSFLAKKTPFVALLYGDSDAQLCATLKKKGVAFQTQGLGQVGKATDFLKENHVKKLVMAGKFHRPQLSKLKVDKKGAVWLAGLLKTPLGDDGLLRFIAQKLAEEGLSVEAPQTCLQKIAVRKGYLTSVKPTDKDAVSISKGFAALDALSPFDVGQALVLLDGVIVGIEGAEGTNGLIERCAGLMQKGQRAILVKAAKVTQDIKLDPPVVGEDTVRLLVSKRFAGVALLAERTLLLQQEACVEQANKARVFIAAFEGSVKAKKDKATI